MNSDKHEAQGIGRREFLSRLSAAATGSALALGNSCQAQDPPSADTTSPAPPLPTIRLGDHNITRTPEQMKKMPAVVTVQIGYPFFASDPLDMIKVVQQVEQPCLGFKILAAGRRCYDKQSVMEAFKFAFEHLKPTDGVIVGMYPRYHDQISQNAQYARQCGTPQGA